MSGSAALAAVLVMGAAAVAAWPPRLPARLPGAAGGAAAGPSRGLVRARALPTLAGALGAVVVAMMAGGQVLSRLGIGDPGGRHGPGTAFALLITACLALAVLLRRRGAASQAARAMRAEAGRACELLAAELAAGAPPSTALQRVAEIHPPLHRVVGASAMGSDVPSAMRVLAAEHAVPTWSRVADGWQLAAQSGAGLAPLLAQVADGEREAVARRRLVTEELAQARATARLMAVLPWLLVGAGSLGEGAAASFLMTTWPGVISAALGCALAAAGLFWMESIERSAAVR